MLRIVTLLGLLALCSILTYASHVGHLHHRQHSLDVRDNPPRERFVTVTTDITITSYHVNHFTHTVTPGSADSVAQQSPLVDAATKETGSPTGTEDLASTNVPQTYGGSSAAANTATATGPDSPSDTNAVPSDAGAIGVTRTGKGTVFDDGYVRVRCTCN
jgi:hypothetical protein